MNNQPLVYRTLEDCLLNFKNVLEQYQLDLKNEHWYRLIKPQMCTGMAGWTCQLVQEDEPHLNWNKFTEKLKTKYNISAEQQKRDGISSLKKLKLDNCKNLEQYIDKFNRLKHLSSVKEPAALVKYLLRVLESDLYAIVSLHITQSRDDKKDTLEYAISQLSNFYNLVTASSSHHTLCWRKTRRKQREIAALVAREIKQQTRRQNYNGQSNHKANYRDASKVKKTRRAGKHRGRNNRDQRSGNGEVLKCFDCGYKPLTYAHKAVCEHNPANKRKPTQKKSKHIVPRPAAAASTDSGASSSSSSSDESNQTFAFVATIGGKKPVSNDMGINSECKQHDSEYCEICSL
ncbi:hypothetical protein BD408DRAFT_438448 [Parasitella parasitica]|nr:hypothetical protein BD408DRAFT_438448 [Parasitella parasitica]